MGNTAILNRKPASANSPATSSNSDWWASSPSTNSCDEIIPEPVSPYNNDSPYNMIAAAAVPNRKYFRLASAPSCRNEYPASTYELIEINSTERKIMIIPTLMDRKCTPSTTLSTKAAYSRSEEHTSELQSRENLVCR